ncbi:MAG TPA: M20/M25/M40 family metallo-hydrolase, partial [Vicinamibacteria bacterium]|nr:M20/M25/M40 family metallo-hydrolase [Vicinamibacteria bacterium]
TVGGCMRTASALLVFSLAAPVVAAPAEMVDLETIGRIRDEGLNRSQVMATVSHLTDHIGPRLTGSPAMAAASEWTRQRLAEWGLNARLETWGPFGRGWTLESVSARMVAPDVMPLVTVPRAWTPGTNGPLRAAVVRLDAETEADLEKAKGALAGRIVLVRPLREIKVPESPAFERYSEAELAELAVYKKEQRRGPYAEGERPDREAMGRRFRLARRLRTFLREEGALAALEPSDRDAGVVRVMGGGSREPGEDPGVPTLVVAAEQYNRMVRLLEAKAGVEVELDVRAAFHDPAPQHNTLAELPGTDKANEVVMLGAHLDSWHGGTGATDNAAGVAAAMEAIRILKALDLEPRRTIRVALWGGEEQGLLGSRHYVKEHFGSRPDPRPEERDVPSFLRQPSGPLTLKPEHSRLAAYFNLDNGTGRVRGIYTQQNVAAAPIFEAWLAPLRDLGVTTVTNRETSGTDHVPFDQVGLPGFQFIQDQADYGTLTHHTHIDVLDRIREEDLVQASVVMAVFAWQAANRDAMLPRKPLPAGTIAAVAPRPGPKAGRSSR